MTDTHEIVMIASSHENKNATGDRFEVNFQEPLQIPKEAKTCTVEVQESTIWWSIPNITQGDNDKLRLLYSPSGLGTQYNLDPLTRGSNITISGTSSNIASNDGTPGFANTVQKIDTNGTTDLFFKFTTALNSVAGIVSSDTVNHDVRLSTTDPTFLFGDSYCVVNVGADLHMYKNGLLDQIFVANALSDGEVVKMSISSNIITISISVAGVWIPLGATIAINTPGTQYVAVVGDDSFNDPVGIDTITEIVTDPNIAPPTIYNITVPQGLYDLTTLNTTIQRELAGVNAPSGLITLSGDNATQKIIIKLKPNTQIDFSIPNSFREMLGFNALIFPAIQSNLTTYEIAQAVASFNRIEYFLIHSDIVDRGIRFNNTYNQTIGRVLIDVKPGSQITSTPFNPSKTDASALIGASRKRLAFWLTDHKNLPVNTIGETWSCRVVIRYTI